MELKAFYLMFFITEAIEMHHAECVIFLYQSNLSASLLFNEV